MKRINSDILVAIDVGTTKICVLVAQKISENNIEIIGIGKAPSLGIARGVVVDVAQAVHTIKQAIKEAELMSGIKIETIGVGISGSHIQSINSHGIVPIKKDQVTNDDIQKVLSAAKAIVIPEGQQILHVLPQYYTIDGEQKVLDPLGMFGVRLEAKAHIITGSVASVQNLVLCCRLAGVTVTDIILEQLASAHAVLTEDEKQLGVGLLDIGGGTSDFAVYQHGTIKYTKVFPIAGNLVSNDIALCMRTTLKDAERIKLHFGSAILHDDYSEFEVELVHGMEKKLVNSHDLAFIIESRISELFNLLDQEITNNSLKNLMPAGLVLTGGGALLKNINKNSSNILNIPVRTGNPNIPQMFKEQLNNPIYSTGYGLLLNMFEDSKKNSLHKLKGSLFSQVFWQMKSWVVDFF